VLEQWAREADVKKQPPSFLRLVAYALPARLRATRLELLRRIRRAYPADLWANHELALDLMKIGKPAEAAAEQLGMRLTAVFKAKSRVLQLLREEVARLEQRP
jgi:hypothetical protein